LSRTDLGRSFGRGTFIDRCLSVVPEHPASIHTNPFL
jgi:hypothetical protein